MISPVPPWMPKTVDAPAASLPFHAVFLVVTLEPTIVGIVVFHALVTVLPVGLEILGQGCDLGFP